MFKVNTTHSPMTKLLFVKATPPKQQSTTSNINIISSLFRQLKIKRQHELTINSIKLHLQIIKVKHSQLDILTSQIAYLPVSNFESTCDLRKLDSSFEHTQPLILSRNTAPICQINQPKNTRTLSPMDFNKQPAISHHLLNKIIIGQPNNQESLKVSKKENQKNCIHHLSKKAKYYVQTEQSMILCSKCAITMVGKGFKVLELVEDHRKTQLNQFLVTINSLLPKFENAISSLTIKKEDVLKYHECQKNKISNYFNSLNERINNLKKQLEITLENNYNLINQLYNDSFQDLKKAMNETLSMKKDIEQNVDRIISQIENQPFLEIMACYNENLNTFVKQIEYVQRKPLELVKLNFGDQLIDVHSENLSNVIQILKTTLLKGNQADLNDSVKEQIENLYMSFENKEKIPFNQKPQYSTLQNEKTNYIKREIPFRSLFDENKIAIDKIKQEEEQQLEESTSQMIEREDIENSYNMMLGSNDCEQEELMLEQINGKIEVKTKGSNLFCSPQFKNN